MSTPPLVFTAAVLAVAASLPRLAALDPQLPPGANFDLTHWKLTLPIGEAHRPTEIEPAALIGAHGYTSEFFHTDPADGAMVFVCPGNGVTTKGSPHPRSELREEVSGSGDNTDWTIGQFARSELSAQCRVEKVGPHHRVIVGQIHGVDFPVIKLVYDYNPGKRTGRLLSQMNRNAPADNVEKEYVLAEGIALGQPFSYVIRTTSEGADARLRSFANGDETRAGDLDETAWIAAPKNGFYFKAGNYCQETKARAEDGCRVAFLALQVIHVAGVRPAVAAGPR